MLCYTVTATARATAYINLLMAHAVKGVTIYISDFKRSISDKLNKDFFSEPSQVNRTVIADIRVCAYHNTMSLQAHLFPLPHMMHTCFWSLWTKALLTP